MKTILQTAGRTLVLLAAALVVVAALLALSQTSLAAHSFDHGSGLPGEGFGRRPAPGFQPNSGEAGGLNAPEDGAFHRRFEGEGHESGLSGFTFFTLVKNLGLIALVVMIYLGASRLFTRRRRAR